MDCDLQGPHAFERPGTRDSRRGTTGINNSSTANAVTDSTSTHSENGVSRSRVPFAAAASRGLDFTKAHLAQTHVAGASLRGEPYQSKAQRRAESKLLPRFPAEPPRRPRRRTVLAIDIWTRVPKRGAERRQLSAEGLGFEVHCAHVLAGQLDGVCWGGAFEWLHAVVEGDSAAVSAHAIHLTGFQSFDAETVVDLLTWQTTDS